MLSLGRSGDETIAGWDFFGGGGGGGGGISDLVFPTTGPFSFFLVFANDC